MIHLYIKTIHAPSSGGYTRHQATFHRTSDIVFAKPSDDPSYLNTQLSLSPLPVDDSSSPSSIPVVVFIANSDVDEYLGPQPMESLADVIATSVGPSGKNSDYLFNLTEAVRKHFPDVRDGHLSQLEEMVNERLSRSGSATA